MNVKKDVVNRSDYPTERSESPEFDPLGTIRSYFPDSPLELPAVSPKKSCSPKRCPYPKRLHTSKQPSTPRSPAVSPMLFNRSDFELARGDFERLLNEAYPSPSRDSGVEDSTENLKALRSVSPAAFPSPARDCGLKNFSGSQPVSATPSPGSDPSSGNVLVENASKHMQTLEGSNRAALISPTRKARVENWIENLRLIGSLSLPTCSLPTGDARIDRTSEIAQILGIESLAARSSPTRKAHICDPSDNQLVIEASAPTADQQPTRIHHVSNSSSNLQVVRSPIPTTANRSDAMIMDVSTNRGPALQNAAAGEYPPVAGKSDNSVKLSASIKAQLNKMSKKKSSREEHQFQATLSPQKRKRDARSPAPSPERHYQSLRNYREAYALPQAVPLRYNPHGPNGIGVFSLFRAPSEIPNVGGYGGHGNQARGYHMVKNRHERAQALPFPLSNTIAKNRCRESSNQSTHTNKPSQGLHSTPPMLGSYEISRAQFVVTPHRSNCLKDSSDPLPKRPDRTRKGIGNGGFANVQQSREYVDWQFANESNAERARNNLVNVKKDGFEISRNGCTLRATAPAGLGVRLWVRGLVPIGRETNSGTY